MAFTLVELLVVIAVIAVLAALTFPIMGAVKRAQTIHRARAELLYVESAIEAYKTKLGFYPPDNGGYYTTNQLYYELMGTKVNLANGAPVSYQTLDSSALINVSGFTAAFGSGTKIVGFVNCSKPGAGDDSPNAVKFLPGLKSAQFLAVTTPAITVLGSTVGGAPIFSNPTTGGEITPYGYNSSDPQHNRKSFDLWIDVTAGGKTNRISNWSEKPIIVPTTAYPGP